MPQTTVKIAAAGVALAALAVVLNPSPEAHRAKIKQDVASRSQLAGLLRLGDLTAFASSYHSLGVMSYTTVNERWVSVGAFGVVWVADLTVRR